MRYPPRADGFRSYALESTTKRSILAATGQIGPGDPYKHPVPGGARKGTLHGNPPRVYPTTGRIEWFLITRTKTDMENIYQINVIRAHLAGENPICPPSLYPPLTLPINPFTPPTSPSQAPNPQIKPPPPPPLDAPPSPPPPQPH